MNRFFTVRKIAYTVAMFVVSTVTIAQDNTLRTLNDGSTAIRDFCAEPEQREWLIATYPEIAAEMAAAEAQLRDEAENAPANRDSDYIIPVVFHIIHDNGPENISFEQIEDAIRVINEDFNAQNADITNAVDAFEDIVADVGIEFRLAQLDPDGNCTNGVVRTESQITYSGGENLKSVSPIWDRSKYLNIWVANDLSGGAAGYTYRPATVSGNFGEQADGIVIRHSYVGSIGTGSYGRSRALTHEIGHWLNLAHTWGNSNTPGLATNCNGDDGISDTPNTTGHDNCDLNAESCGSLDNVQNYMDYTYCYCMFTEGQKTAMINALNSSVAERNNLITEQNLLETGVNLEPELCVADFSVDRSIICVGDTVLLTDLSYNAPESWLWDVPGAEIINNGEPEAAVVFSEPGTYSVSLSVTNAQSALEVTKENFITILGIGELGFPLEEGFESMTTLEESDWLVEADGDRTWEWTDQAAFTGNSAVRIRNNGKQDGESERLMSRTIAVPPADSNLVLSFKYAFAYRTAGESDDRLRIYVSGNCGEFFSLRRSISTSTLPTAPNQNANFIPSSEQWTEVQVDNILPNVATDQFRIMFEFISGGGNNIWLDDINLFTNSTSSVNEVLENFSWKVYPNPARNLTTLEWTAEETFNQARFRVMDASGRTVSILPVGTVQPGQNRVELNISELAPGFYLVSFESSEGNSPARRIIKQ